MTDLSKIDTTIYLGNFSIHQPVTAFTGIMIAALCLLFYIQIHKTGTTGKSSHSWKWFFGFMMLATFLGACCHAFFSDHESIQYKAAWLSMQVFNGFSVYSAQQATLESVLNNSENKSMWQNIYYIQLVLYVPSVFLFQNFLTVVINTAVGLIPVMVLHFKDSKIVTSSKYIAYGILISFLTAVIHLGKFSLGKYFNHLDMAHVFIMINLWVMQKGVLEKAIS